MIMTSETEALKSEIEQAILKSELSYGDVTKVLKYFIVVYQDKANNLLNGTSIQKVVETPRFSWDQKD